MCVFCYLAPLPKIVGTWFPGSKLSRLCAVPCSKVQCRAVQCRAVQCIAVQCSAVQCSAAQYSEVQCSAMHSRGWFPWPGGISWRQKVKRGHPLAADVGEGTGSSDKAPAPNPARHRVTTLLKKNDMSHMTCDTWPNRPSGPIRWQKVQKLKKCLYIGVNIT